MRQDISPNRRAWTSPVVDPLLSAFTRTLGGKDGSAASLRIVQVEVATRVGTYINLARTVRDDATLARFIEAAAQERAKIIEQAAKPQLTGHGLQPHLPRRGALLCG